MNSASALPRPAQSCDNRTIQNVYITIHIVYYTFHTVNYTLCICTFCIVNIPLRLLPVLSRQYGPLCMYKLYRYKTYRRYTKCTVVRFIDTLYKTYMVRLSLCCTLCIYTNCIVRNVAIHIVYIQFVYLAIVLVRYDFSARILLLYKTYIIGIFCIFNHFRKICFFIEKVLQK